MHGMAVPRETVSRALEQAVAAGWVMRNPGHGHPLRPEYLLTGAGVIMAEAAHRLVSATAEAGCAIPALSRWSLPLLRTMQEGHDRFNAIQRALVPATPRALTLSLRAMQGSALIMRRVVDDWPPVSLYHLTERGVLVARAT